MILTCPSCGTQYVVKDGAIPPEGRQVRCAACKHSWHQNPEEQEEESSVAAAGPPPAASFAESFPAPGPSEQTEETGPSEESLAEATLIEPRSGPEAEERAYDESLIDRESTSPAVPAPSSAEPGQGDEAQLGPAATDFEEPEAEAASDAFSPFASNEVPEPRLRGPLGGILILVAVVILLAAAFWFFAPSTLKARLGLAATDATPLQLVTTHMDRQHLESGNDLLTLTGRVINPSAKEQMVPPIQAQLKNKSGQVVYSWTIQPPTPSLAAGASASFNSAEVSVPPGGEELTITLGQSGARKS